MQKWPWHQPSFHTSLHEDSSVTDRTAEMNKEDLDRIMAVVIKSSPFVSWWRSEFDVGIEQWTSSWLWMRLLPHLSQLSAYWCLLNHARSSLPTPKFDKGFQQPMGQRPLNILKAPKQRRFKNSNMESCVLLRSPPQDRPSYCSTHLTRVVSLEDSQQIHQD